MDKKCKYCKGTGFVELFNTKKPCLDCDFHKDPPTTTTYTAGYDLASFNPIIEEWQITFNYPDTSSNIPSSGWTSYTS